MKYYQRLYKCPKCGMLSSTNVDVCDECGHDVDHEPFLRTVGYWQNEKGWLTQLFHPGAGRWVEK